MSDLLDYGGNGAHVYGSCVEDRRKSAWMKAKDRGCDCQMTITTENHGCTITMEHEEHCAYIRAIREGRA